MRKTAVKNKYADNGNVMSYEFKFFNYLLLNIIKKLLLIQNKNIEM